MRWRPCHNNSKFYNNFSHTFEREHALGISRNKHVIYRIVDGDEHVINHRICNAHVYM